MSFLNCLFLLEYRQSRSMKPLPPYPGDTLRGIHCYGLETSQKFHSSRNKGDEFSTTLQVVCNILGRLESFLLGKWRKKHLRLLPLFYSPASRLQFFKIQRDSWANSPTCTGFFSTRSARHFLLLQTSYRKLFTEQYIPINMKVTSWILETKEREIFTIYYDTSKILNDWNWTKTSRRQARILEMWFREHASGSAQWENAHYNCWQSGSPLYCFYHC